ncbi:glycosyltransferase [endosymbiont 'TC1' of Trimyema compressum]|uniref:glycosyltransferase family 2 protein n=1 Tax=endosymbiont 'TC1' of Trimyema compressum TaxID=243899 RepID=UPI0007F0D7CA|nr:glycosyltransferase family 2 protein [endosymbiont 'TC1' of Trimyema compressum]AMP20888.1 glycosyltransferase [endosymbiont 'TC1' of Trimyema compressum]
MKKTLYLVIPCYNEEPVIEETTRRLTKKLDQLIAEDRIATTSRILYVDDGSKDRTWILIEYLHKENPYVCGLKLAHNKGHQNALLAGLMYAKNICDYSVSMDADLQDDIGVIDGFIEKYNEGCHIVYGVRNSRETDTKFKKMTAIGFYKFMAKLGVDIVYNHADCRLMSNQALEALAEYKEINLFLRGLVPLIGYKNDTVYYDRNERFAGESKYPLSKMLKFAWEGVTSFSVKPLRMIASIGILIFIISFIILIVALINKILGNPVAGWTGLISSIWLLGGIQLFALGICGEYIGKIYNEVKGRPRYLGETFLKK